MIKQSSEKSPVVIEAGLPGTKEIPAIPQKLRHGIDELNFAEFPVATLSAITSRENQRTLEYADEIPDPRQPGKTIVRKLRISAGGSKGLLTPQDDWVILGLFQMAKLQGFHSEKLYFTRYHLLKLLGWGTNARDYNKIQDSLQRIAEVTFHFERAWWDPAAKSFVNRTFSLYNDLEIYEDENSQSRKPNISQRSFPFACSSLKWSEFLYENFLNRGIKGLNFDFVKSLSKQASRRMFRFLDKRFFKRDTLDMPLEIFACQHMGFKSGQRTSELKRLLKPAIQELEERRYISALPDKERFPKVRKGEYRIVFQKGAFNPSEVEGSIAALPEEAEKHLVRRAKPLIERGVTQAEAIKLVRGFSESIIRHQLDVFDWLVEKGKAPKNRGAFLRTAIVENYVPPADYVDRHTREENARQAELQKKLAAEAQEKKKAQERAKAASEKEARKARQETTDAWWNSLDAAERRREEAKALAAADRFQAEVIGRGGPFGQATKKELFQRHALAQLAAQ